MPLPAPKPLSFVPYYITSFCSLFYPLSLLSDLLSSPSPFLGETCSPVVGSDYIIQASPPAQMVSLPSAPKLRPRMQSC